MESLKFVAIFILFSSLSHESVQGFAFERQRDFAPTADASEIVQQLSSTLTSILQAVQEGVQGTKLEKAMMTATELADQFLEETGSSVSDEDVEDLIVKLSTDYQPLLDDTLDHGLQKIDLAFELLKDLLDMLSKSTEDDGLSVLVAAIGMTAEDIVENVDTIRTLYVHIFKEMSKEVIKRQWNFSSDGLSHTWNHNDGSSSTLGGKVNPDFSSGSLFGSHTWNSGNGQGTVKGNLGLSPSGLNGGGISGSYSWNNGKTNVGGNLNFDSLGNPSAGFTFSHTFGRREIANQ